jgi:3-dehydroquinate dehydratase
MWIVTAMEYLTVTMDARLTLKRQNQERVAVERLRRILTTMASQTVKICAPTTFTRPSLALADATSRILMPTAMEHLTVMIFVL